ncbi:MAG: selenium-binding protein SBP56-related protein [Gemmatimonadota bacterium]
MKQRTAAVTTILAGLTLATAALAPFEPWPAPDRASHLDESVFVNGLDAGEPESVLYVWTRDADARDSDFLAVVDVDPASDRFGEIIDVEPTGSAGNEAHHFGYTAAANRIFAGGLFSNRLFIYDVGGDPRSPELLRTVDLDHTGYSGPHTLYAVPDGVLLAMLGTPDGGGPAALVKVDDDGRFVEAYPQQGHDGVPEHMYDVGVKPEMNRMITSSWAHPQHVKMEGGSPPERTADEVVVWNWRTKEVLQVEELDLAPLEVRWQHGPAARGGFINTAYGNTVWYWEDDDRDGHIDFHRIIELPEGAAPADMRISYDNRFLYVSNFGGGSVQQYDVGDPLNPRLVDEVELPHPNMMKLSPDSERLYVTNSLLSTMDPDEDFRAWLLHVGPDGMSVDERFDPDFKGFETGPAGPHDMLLK